MHIFLSLHVCTVCIVNDSTNKKEYSYSLLWSDGNGGREFTPRQLQDFRMFVSAGTHTYIHKYIHTYTHCIHTCYSYY